MKFQNVLFLLFCLGITSCYPSSSTKSYETSVKVVDMLGNPVKNREVRLFIDRKPLSRDTINTLVQPKMTAFTNNLGEVKFSFDLIPNDFADDIAKIVVKEDSNFVAINGIEQSVGSSRDVKGVIKMSGTIRMDSFVPFNIQFKSNRTNISGVSFKLQTKELNNNFSAIDNPYKWAFVSFSQYNRASTTLDTIIRTKVCLRTPMQTSSSIQLSGGNTLPGVYFIDSNHVRKGLFVNEIN